MYDNFLKSWDINLDLALESNEVFQKKSPKSLLGVKSEEKNYDFAKVTTVQIKDKEAEEALGKKIGTYITIESTFLRENEPQKHFKLGELLAKEISKLFSLSEKDSVLIVGLGNWKATPDALGPKVINQTMVTRHIFEYAPKELLNGIKRVSAIAPGVLGITGLETAEIVKGIVEKTKPDLIIAIDSLSSKNLNRIGTTIQISNTGINPGSGVGNQRKGLTKETLGVPVIAIGIPTVVNGAIIAKDTIDIFMELLHDNPDIYQIIKNIYPNREDEVIKKVLEPFGGHLMVTPKEIDDLMSRSSKIVASAITKSLHPDLSPNEYEYYLN